MKKILFVCLGNICRSPAAESIFKKLLQKENLNEKYECHSAGTSAYHVGDEADPRMRQILELRGYPPTTKSRQFIEDDFETFDYIIAMDKKNIRSILKLDPQKKYLKKVLLITNFSTQFDDDGVPDPYFGDREGFKHVVELLEDCCNSLLDFLENGGITWT